MGDPKVERGRQRGMIAMWMYRRDSRREWNIAASDSIAPSFAGHDRPHDRSATNVMAGNHRNVFGVRCHRGVIRGDLASLDLIYEIARNVNGRPTARGPQSSASCRIALTCEWGFSV